MKITRRSFVGIALALLATPALAKRRPPLRVEGAFVGVEQGDYFHLDVKDDQGKTWSFFILQDDAPGLKDVMAHPENYKGSRLQVTYRKVSKVIPESGPKPMDILEAVDARKL